jgi:riboflavin synthase
MSMFKDPFYIPHLPEEEKEREKQINSLVLTKRSRKSKLNQMALICRHQMLWQFPGENQRNNWR